MLHYAYDWLARFWTTLIVSYLKDNRRPRFDVSLCESCVTGTESVNTDVAEPKIDTTWSTFYIVINTFHLGYKNQSVYAVSGTSRCLFSDKHKTHRYSVGRTYSCWMLNCWCITWPVGFKRLICGWVRMHPEWFFFNFIVLAVLCWGNIETTGLLD